MDFQALETTLRRELPGLNISTGVPLSRYTSFAIGGPAALMAEPGDEKQLARLYEICLGCGIKPVVLGSGTNVLAPDEGLEALVIRTKAVEALSREGETGFYAGCGVPLSRLAAFAARAGRAGMEFAHGIPGSVGGGVLMNAGAYGGELKNVVKSVTWLTPEGDIKEITRDEADFVYRSSLFEKTGGLIIAARFELHPDEPERITERMGALAAKRRASQPLELPSAGSTFKRPVGGYAAALIDEAGLKGFTVGGAQVSEKHAGFVVNRGGATCADVLNLIKYIQKTVFDNSGIMLEPEVRLLAGGNGGS